MENGKTALGLDTNVGALLVLPGEPGLLLRSYLQYRRDRYGQRE